MADRYIPDPQARWAYENRYDSDHTRPYMSPAARRILERQTRTSPTQATGAGTLTSTTAPLAGMARTIDRGPLQIPDAPLSDIMRAIDGVRAAGDLELAQGLEVAITQLGAAAAFEIPSITAGAGSVFDWTDFGDDGRHASLGLSRWSTVADFPAPAGPEHHNKVGHMYFDPNDNSPGSWPPPNDNDGKPFPHIPDYPHEFGFPGKEQRWPGGAPGDQVTPPPWEGPDSQKRPDTQNPNAHDAPARNTGPSSSNSSPGQGSRNAPTPQAEKPPKNPKQSVASWSPDDSGPDDLLSQMLIAMLPEHLRHRAPLHPSAAGPGANYGPDGHSGSPRPHRLDIGPMVDEPRLGRKMTASEIVRLATRLRYRPGGGPDGR